MSYENILTEIHGKVGLIRFNRPGARNALSAALIAELRCALDAFEMADDIGAVVITGDDRAFAAGADIGEMAAMSSFAGVFRREFSGADWLRIATCRKPVIAAVAGYALGGGCELAMMCDFVLAADNARFGQPEITVGATPGCGGTQRLPRAIGKAKAMEMCLTGRLMDAAEAERTGLVARVVPVACLVEEAIRTAARIADLSRPVAMLIKECVNRAFEAPLAEGVLFERRMFQACFALDDRREGMTAFKSKRTPQFGDR
ncbi:MAG TPA: enoyl-CoA hydratase-related protein [Vineibacter sp.]|nr:enoyl-CoA hydratase-related protein [Vineibacter sp.]